MPLNIPILPRNYLIHNRYRIMRLLGEGGFGHVYEATDETFDKDIALKETLVEDENFKKAFEREAKLLAKLNHPNIPRVTDYFFDGRKQYLVMDLIEGLSLEELLTLHKRPYSYEEVLPWAYQLLDALNYLHNIKPYPVIHRDIKPANIRISKEGKVFLVDFGIAKGKIVDSSDDEYAPLSSSVKAMSPAYASLEQITGAGTDARSDIYSIGATLYHLLTSQHPVWASQRYDRFNKGQGDPLIPPHKKNPSVPEAISAVLLRAMSLNSKDRFASATEMRQALLEATPLAPKSAESPLLEPINVGKIISEQTTKLSDRIFICYRREDSAPQAYRLNDWLSNRQFQTFMDIDTIPYGVDFRQAINEELESCSIFLVLIGKQWVTSERDGQRRLDNSNDLVRLEIANALSRGVRVIPILVQDANMPSANDLPDEIKELAYRNALSLNDIRWKDDVERLVRALNRTLVDLKETRKKEAAQKIAEEETRKREEEIARKAEREEHQRQGAEAKRRAEEARIEAEARRVAEAARQAEEERLRKEREAKQRAEEEAEQKAEENRQIAEAARRAEEQRRREEEERLREETEERERLKAEEAVRLAQEARTRAEADALKRAEQENEQERVETEQRRFEEANRLEEEKVLAGEEHRETDNEGGENNGADSNSRGTKTEPSATQPSEQISGPYSPAAAATMDPTLKVDKPPAPVVNPTPSQASATTLPPHQKPFSAKFWIVLGALALLIAFIVFAASRGFWFGGNSNAEVRRENEPAPKPTSMTGTAVDATKGAPTLEVTPLGSAISSPDDLFQVTLSADGQTLASTGGNKVRLWRVSEPHKSIELEDKTVGELKWLGVAFSPDGQMLACGNDQGALQLWRLSDNSSIKNITTQAGNIFRLGFSADSQTLFSAGIDSSQTKKIQLWRLSDMSTLGEITCGRDQTIIAISPDKRIAAVADVQNGLQLWSIESKGVLRGLEGDVKKALYGAFSADGELLALGNKDGTVQLINVTDGRLLQTLAGPKSEVNRVSLSPDIKMVAAGWSDGTVQIWRVSDGGFIKSLTEQKQGVKSLAFSANGRVLASAYADKTIRLWQISEKGQ